MMSSDDRPEPTSYQRPVPAGPGDSVRAEATMAAMRQVFVGFFDAEYHPVVRFVMRFGAGLPDAQDAAQQAFLQVWNNMRRREWDEITNQRAWVRTVALRRYRARPGTRIEIPLGPHIDLPQPGTGHAELTDQARDALALLRRLDPDCREVIALALDDIPAADIAAALGISQQKVRDLRKKTRKQLRKHAPAVRREGRNQR
ncbi:sigma-70 family RNA polymerase sigma factor [Actinomadura graeca]|uniref:Sigma-70 family RNA polymerase sigma factor n=1 Tax=Actinomadura graeca TaxID=2750812 RepID=A0ABX8R3V7_9ACTN|nr:sigma-70 family RNA polymerase sigma factor [Actinomadura graeca]QXJ25756.1 sigma-70 family RNA polymerase sigma factor [Actinomadura graeca]